MEDLALPQHVAFKGDNDKYLGFFLDDKFRPYLNFGYDDLSSPYVKHEVLTDPNNGSYVHLKCCYNNKFWHSEDTDAEVENVPYIIAAADSFNSDQSSLLCTLFQPNFLSSDRVTLRELRHNKLVARRALGELKTTLGNSLIVGDDAHQEHGVMEYYDLGLLVTLPKYIAFKGDNDKYLAADDVKYLQFNETDIGAEAVRHEVVRVGDGTVMLKCLQWNKFWRWTPDYICADAVDDNSSDHKFLLFRPIKVDDQRVALLCLGNERFCKRLTNDYLHAEADSLERAAILRVEETTLCRKLRSIIYDKNNAYIQVGEPEILFQATANNTSDQDTTLQVDYTYTEKDSASWKSAESFTSDVNLRIEGSIPDIIDWNLEVKDDYSWSVESARTKETLKTEKGSYGVPVKAGKTVEVTVKGIPVQCDVKFSCIQEDLLTTGKTVKIRRDDGVFNRLKTTDIRFETRFR